jgi:heme-degrading monooxygenase HmoA
VLISFFRYLPGQKRWAMKQMGVIPRRLKGTEGMTFHKMLGTGGGLGYSFKPDFNTYALLTVWDRREDADTFERSSVVMNAFRQRTEEVYTLFLHPIKSRGKWSKKEPFRPAEPLPGNPLIVVLTRATLKMRYYIPFWKRVGAVSRSHEGAPGLIFTKGVGERPWIMQATFSVWGSLDEMMAFAHQKDGKHFEAIATTRRLKGFKEELYARFQPVESRGTWRGSDPVGEAIRLEKRSG